MEAAEYEKLLDNYRGRCQECGREPVLLDFQSDYDGMRQVCLLDREECERLASEQSAREAEEFQRRIEAGDRQALAVKAMIDSFNSLYVDLAGPKHLRLDPEKPRTMEWRRFGGLPSQEKGP